MRWTRASTKARATWYSLGKEGDKVSGEGRGKGRGCQQFSTPRHAPHVAVAAVHLKALVGDVKLQLRALELGHAGHLLVEAALRVQLDARVEKRARRAHLRLDVRQLVLDRLKVRERAWVERGRQVVQN